MMHAAHRISGLLKAAGEPPAIPEQPRVVQVRALDTRAPQAALGFSNGCPGQPRPSTPRAGSSS